MAESTLTLTQAVVQQKLGRFFGYGRGTVAGDVAWSTVQLADINDSIESGQRRFYWPEPEQEGGTSYDWSFLKPVGTFYLIAAQQVVPLPEDFGGFEGKITVLSGTNTAMPFRIEWRNEANIREMYAAAPTLQGPPMYASTQFLKGTGPVSANRMQLFIFPAADKSYTIQCQYYVNPDAITPANPYPYGGTPHAETFLESCLAVAEERIDDASSVHMESFQRRLAASISMDRRLKPQKLGYNGDSSDNLAEWDRSLSHWWGSAVTYNGQTFT
jgi:hypothetical protein